MYVWIDSILKNDPCISNLICEFQSRYAGIEQTTLWQQILGLSTSSSPINIDMWVYYHNELIFRYTISANTYCPIVYSLFSNEMITLMMLSFCQLTCQFDYGRFKFLYIGLFFCNCFFYIPFCRCNSFFFYISWNFHLIHTIDRLVH